MKNNSRQVAQAVLDNTYTTGKKNIKLYLKIAKMLGLKWKDGQTIRGLKDIKADVLYEEAISTNNISVAAHSTENGFTATLGYKTCEAYTRLDFSGGSCKKLKHKELKIIHKVLKAQLNDKLEEINKMLKYETI